MTELAKDESMKRVRGEKGEGEEEDNHRLQAQAFLNRSFAYGYNQRSIYEKLMNEMKAKGEFC